MADEAHVEILHRGVENWNRWRMQNPQTQPDLRGADLSGQHLRGVILTDAQMTEADLSHADVSEARMKDVHLWKANLGNTNLAHADLRWADLWNSDLRHANLAEADLMEAILARADLAHADLSNANLAEANLVGTTVEEATLTRAKVYGISAWNLVGSPGDQSDLVITAPNEPVVTVDDVEVAQFVYLLLHNEKIRRVIDTITSKVVLILGRFSDERKEVLDRLRDELRLRNFSPVLFDFDVPEDRNITETVTLLARMARFVVADLTDPRSIPQELQAIVPDLPSVPVQPIVVAGQKPWAMFPDLREYRWMLEPYPYDGEESLIANLATHVIAPPDEYRSALEARRAEA